MATLCIRSVLIQMLNGQGYDTAKHFSTVVYHHAHSSITLRVNHHNFEHHPEENLQQAKPFKVGNDDAVASSPLCAMITIEP